MFHPGLEIELFRWRLAGRRARLWWRDDDAAGATPALERLLAISAAGATPLTLAVVPAGRKAALADLLAGALQADVVQHGVDHRNRRAGPVAGEFPHDWPRVRLTTELAWGWARIAGLPGALPVFVPPWNDAHPQLERALAECGYAGWSANGAVEQAPGGRRMDVHLDLLRWRGGARFRGQGRLLADLRRELARRRKAGLWTAPVGLLTHHLAHDEAAWAFLERFIGWCGRRDGLEWFALRDLIGKGVMTPKAASHLWAVA